MKMTPEKAIKVWRMHEVKGLTYEAIGKKMGISKDTASRWCFVVDGDAELLDQAKGGSPTPMTGVDFEPNPKSKPKMLPSIQRLKDENAFLRWWNEGERSGYVERLLKELQEK